MDKKINPWVNKLLGVYQFSKVGNSDNRGLDTEFAQETYIPTKLDTELLPDVVNGLYKAVFLTGNAGDGKTAFLEKVYSNLITSGGEEIEKNAAGWIVKFNNKIYKACYDASESEKEGKISSNERLLKIYDHLKGNDEPKTNIIVLTAINDGKLHAFFNQYKKEFYWLASTIFRIIFDNKSDTSSVCIVNLKERTLIDLEFDGVNENSLFDKNLKIFTDPKNWEICSNCSSNHLCPIYFNVKNLGLEEHSSLVRARLKLLFTISYLRKQRHNTIRNIRSALSFIITSNLDCSDVHRMVEQADHSEIYKHRYFNSIFNSPDESLMELREIDPGLKLLPKLDRKICSFHTAQQFEQLKKILFCGDDLIDFNKIQFNSDEIITIWRRRFYFEGEEEKLREEFNEIEEYHNLLPYKYLKSYLKHLKKQGNIELLRRDISKGIAQLEGIRIPSLAEKRLLIKITHNSKEGLTVCKQFPIEEFEIFTPRYEKKYLETIPHQMFLRHKESKIQTKINLDIFEILRRMADGQLPASEEQKPILDELTEFKSRLHRLKADELLLIESNGLFHFIQKSKGQIERVVESTYEN